MEESDRKVHFKLLREFLEVKAPGFQFVGAYKLFRKTKGKRGWNGKTSLLYNDMSFPTGLLPKVVEFLKKKTKLKIIDERDMRRLTISPSNVTVKLRDYQVDAMNAAIENKWEDLWWPRGILEMATGSGKTVVAAALIQYFGRIRTLVVVHTRTLLHHSYRS